MGFCCPGWFCSKDGCVESAERLEKGNERQAKGLVTNYGEGVGLQNRKGGTSDVLPLQKGGGAENILAIPKGGHNKF